MIARVVVGLSLCAVVFGANAVDAQACDPACTWGQPCACGAGFHCLAGSCIPTCTPECPAGTVCSAPARCTRDPSLPPEAPIMTPVPPPAPIVAPAPPPAAREATADECSNNIDDDGDGRADCADTACSAFVFCHSGGRADVRSAPVEPRVTHRSLIWMQVTGVIAWGLAFVSGVIVTAAVGGSGQSIGINAVPLAGPWMCLGHLCERPDPYAAALIADGAVQALGLLFLIIGSAVQVEQVDRRFTFAPWVGPTATGGELTLHF
jgi:hypothetical protein